jgi:hypothetical protein
MIRSIVHLAFRFHRSNLEMSNIGQRLEENQDQLASAVAQLYAGPIANETGHLYENFQYGSGKLNDQLSSILDWLGHRFLIIGNKTGHLIRAGFRRIGDLFGTAVDRSDEFIGNALIEDGKRVHDAGSSDSRLVKETERASYSD